ncbi:Hsp70 protein-domain-containing protein [Mycena vulgaris]|nr:Hsp70 protein-domain-containing protein [Mycena vulgaris]
MVQSPSICLVPSICLDLAHSPYLAFSLGFNKIGFFRRKTAPDVIPRNPSKSALTYLPSCLFSCLRLFPRAPLAAPVLSSFALLLWIHRFLCLQCVSAWAAPEIIANDQGNRTTPSFVSFPDNARLIGDAAKHQVAVNLINTVFNAKRLVGRKFEDSEVQADMKHFPFTVFSKRGKPCIRVDYLGKQKEFICLFFLLYPLRMLTSGCPPDLSSNLRVLRRLRTVPPASVPNVPSRPPRRPPSRLTPSSFEGIDFYTSITRARFEEFCQDLFRSTLEPVEKVLRDSKMDKTNVHEIVLVGGSRIVKLVSNFFNGKEPNKSINPDDAVAYGTAPQAAILSRDTSEKPQDLHPLDVVPLSLGTETAGGVMTAPIKRTTTTPLRSLNPSRPTPTASPVFSSRLTRASLPALTSPPAPRCVPQVDANGILNVSAADKTTDKSNRITIANDKGRPSKEDIERMVDGAERYKAEDEAAAPRITSKNALESYAYNLRDSINDEKLADKFEAAEKTKLESAVNDIMKWLRVAGGFEGGVRNGMFFFYLSSVHICTSAIHSAFQSPLCDNVRRRRPKAVRKEPEKKQKKLQKLGGLEPTISIYERVHTNQLNYETLPLQAPEL